MGPAPRRAGNTMISQGRPQPRRERRQRAGRRWGARHPAVAPWPWWLVAAALATVVAAGETRADTKGAGAPLGRLEQESVDEALAANGWVIDHHPEGKIIGAIRVVNQEVFSKHDWWFRWFNHFHRTTRSWVIDRELLMKPGQPYDQALVEESIRNLQAGSKMILYGKSLTAPDLSSVVVILPIVSPSPPATVDLLVVTRDVWSLRFNTNFEFQQSTLSLLETSLSENNLFGWRKFLSLGFSMDLGAFWTGPTYFDPNIAGTRLTLTASADAYYTRATGDYEGNRESFALTYPLFSLASKWGGSIEVLHQDTVLRSFRGTSPRPVNLLVLDADAFSPTLVPVPYVYRRKYAGVDVYGVRQLGHAFIHRLRFGYQLNSRRFEVPEDFPDPALAPLFLAQVAPGSETRSEPYLQYDAFTPRYAIYRDLDTFDLRENRQLGPIVSAIIAYGAPELGADFRAWPMGITLGWAVGPAGGYGLATVTLAGRLRDDGFIDQHLLGTAYAASPVIRRIARVIVSGRIEAFRRDTQRDIISLGGDNGLRGYAIGDFIGTSAVVGHVEARTVPLAIFSQRIGGVLFYDVGDAAASFSQMIIQHDLGLGMRWLIPQLNSSVVRIDWAFATQSTAFTRAGFPGRVTAGFQQSFQGL